MKIKHLVSALVLAVSTLALVVWGLASADKMVDGPQNPIEPKPMQKGDAQRGRDVFRFETFGSEVFWTDVVGVTKGRLEKKGSVLSALRNGVSFDSDAIPPQLRAAIEREVKTDLSPAKAPTLNDPAVMTELIKDNAVIGMVEHNGKTGVTCALCHTITDGSVFSLGDKGSIGKRIDGPTPHGLEVGHLLAEASNSRALYTLLQLDKGGKAIGRQPQYHLTKDSSEADVDAYFNDPKAWPPGTFDDTPDGIGNPIEIPPLFRQDLSAPYGTSGQADQLDDFSNMVYTILFDQTNLLTPGGRKLIHILGGADGDKMLDDYAAVLKATNAPSGPFVVAKDGLEVGKPSTPTGKRVDNQKLLDLNAYLASLKAPAGHSEDATQVASGRQVFLSSCTSCHFADPNRAVDARLVPMNKIWPGYNPTIIAKRISPLSPVQNAPGTFDDKMIVVDASPLGGIRGNALPLLLDLARKRTFLHDNSVPTLEELLDPKRGSKSPHPFYVPDATARRNVAAFLRSLGS